MLDAANDFAWQQAVDRGIAEELRPYFERISINLSVLRQMTTDFRDPTVWLVIVIGVAVVGSGYLGFIPWMIGLLVIDGRRFVNVLVTDEWGPLAPADGHQRKYYAPGVGQILNTPRSASKHKDNEKLINLTRVSPQGLAEVNAQVLRLDRHARTVKPGVYGKSQLAQATL